MKQVLSYYLLLINAVGFLIMCIDKLLAKKQARRVPERTLLWVAALGGSFGSLLGMMLAHHKTRKPKFYITVPLLLALQAAAVGWYYLKLQKTCRGRSLDRFCFQESTPLPVLFRQLTSSRRRST